MYSDGTGLVDLVSGSDGNISPFVSYKNFLEMAEYLRFQLNTAPHVSLAGMVGSTGALVMKARFQQKVRSSGSLLAFGKWVSENHRAFSKTLL